MSTSQQLVPVAIALGVVAATGGVLYWWFTRKQNRAKLLQDPDKSYNIPLVEKKDVSHDTRLFRFGLPSPEHVLGLPIGQHIYVSARVNDKLVVRPYTPVSNDDEHGYMDLIVKVYYKDTHPKFPQGGKMTQHLDGLQIGDSIQVRGPNGLLQYANHGNFDIRTKKGGPVKRVHAKKMGMIAGGTGITPMYQLIKHILQMENDHTELSLIFANQSDRDILLRDELEAFAAKYPDQFHLWFTLDRPPNDWPYGSGFVTAEMISEHLPGPDTDCLILMCGPPPMIDFACKPNLDKLGYPPDARFSY